MASTFGAPKCAQATLASSRFESVTFSPAISDSLDNGLRETFALFVAGHSLSGQEVAHCAPNLAFDVAEAMLLLFRLGLVPDGGRYLPQLPKQLMGGRPLGQSFAYLASDFCGPVVVINDLLADVAPEVVLA